MDRTETEITQLGSPAAATRHLPVRVLEGGRYRCFPEAQPTPVERMASCGP